ncbi:MAG: hypothetical protein AAB434_10460 [Planctomycetota bacterium]
MKRVFEAAMLMMLALSVAALAGDIDEGAKRTLEGLSTSWRGESAGGVCGAFPEGDAKVSFRLGGRSDSFSREQAEGVLDSYFDEVAVSKVSLRKNGYSGGGKRFSATYDYEYADSNGGKHTGLLQFSIENQDGRWVLQSVSAD